MDTSSEQLFEMIKRWLREKNITQTSLARILGIRQPSLSAMFSGKTKLPLKRFQAILQILNPEDGEAQKALLLYGMSGQSELEKKIPVPENTLDFFRKQKEEIKQESAADLDCPDNASGKKHHFRELLSEPDTIRLLEYWQELSESKRYEILAVLAQIKETGTSLFLPRQEPFCLPGSLDIPHTRENGKK